MKFGKDLENSKIDEFRHLYCDYNGLKKLIKTLETKDVDTTGLNSHSAVSMFNVPYHSIKTDDSGRTNNERVFIDAFEQEVIKVNGFFGTKYQEIETRLVGAYSRLAEVINQFKTAKRQKKDLSPDRSAQLVQAYWREKYEAELACKSTVDLTQFCQQNILAFKKIAKKYSKRVNPSSSNWLMRHVEKQHFFASDMDMLVMGISDVYRMVNWIETKRFDLISMYLNEEDIAIIQQNMIPNTNVKKSSGAWVPPESFKRKTEKYWVDPEVIVKVKVMLAKRIPILIFGKDQKKEDKKRMKNFGMRVRPLWMNMPPVTPNPAQSDKSVSSLISSVYYDNLSHEIYKERINKEHGAILVRSRWYGQIEPTGQMFMERKIHRDSAISEEESVKERFEIPRAVLPLYAKGEWRMEDIHYELEKKMSASKLESMYNLASEIQDAITQRDMRPTVRTTYLRTAFQDQASNEFRATMDTHLIITKEDQSTSQRYSSFDSKNTSDVHMFPRAILELKYGFDSETDPPAWITELIEMEGVKKCQKFSKFIHSSAVMHPQVMDIVKPSWFDEVFSFKHKIEASDINNENLVVLQAKDKDQKEKSSRNLKQESVDISTDFSVDFNEENDEIELLEAKDMNIPLLEKPKRERKPTPTFRPLKPKPTVSAKTPPPPKKKDTDVKDLDAPPKTTKKWIKTAMSNERTLLNWLQPIVILLGVAVSLMSMAAKTGQIFGLIIAGLAVVFSLYALVMFHRRRIAIGARYLFGHDDPIGPTIMVLMIVAALVVTSIITFMQNVRIGGSGGYSDIVLSGNDTYLSSKEYQIRIFPDKFEGNLEYNLQAFTEYAEKLPRPVDFILSNEYKVGSKKLIFLKNPQDPQLFFKLEEPQLYSPSTGTFGRKGKKFEMSMKYSQVDDLESFVAPKIDLNNKPYIAGAQQKMEQDIYCDHQKYSHATKLTLNLPSSVSITKDNALDYVLQYFGSQYSAWSEVSEIYYSERSYDLDINPSTSKTRLKSLITLRYPNTESMINNDLTAPESQAVEYSWRLPRSNFTLESEVVQLHKLLCSTDYAIKMN